MSCWICGGPSGERECAACREKFIMGDPFPAPQKAEAEAAAEELADNLRVIYPEYTVRVVENCCSRFEVVVEVPFEKAHGPLSKATMP